MGLLHKTIIALTIISVSVTLVQCQRKRVRVNPLASMLKNILSPSNTEGAMQLLKLASAGAKNCQCGNPNPYLTEEIIVPVGLPQPYQRGYVPLPKGYPKVTQNLPLLELTQPAIEIPRGYPKCSGPLQYNRLEVTQPIIEAVQPVIEVPIGYPKYGGPVQYQPVPNCGPDPVSSCGCGPEKCQCNPVTPAPLVNPYLPAASPVSAIAPPTSSLLPPANLNQCRCNFLRKIPIPPPTL